MSSPGVVPKTLIHWIAGSRGDATGPMCSTRWGPIAAWCRFAQPLGVHGLIDGKVMPKDDTKPPEPIAVEELLAEDDGPRPGILYLTKSEFGGVKMSDNNTFFGAGPDPRDTPLKIRAPKLSPEDDANIDALVRVIEARTQGREPTHSVLEAYNKSIHVDLHAGATGPRASVPADAESTSPGGKPRVTPSVSRKRSRSHRAHALWGVGLATVLVAAAAMLWTFAPASHTKQLRAAPVPTEPLMMASTSPTVLPIARVEEAPMAQFAASSANVVRAPPKTPIVGTASSAPPATTQPRTRRAGVLDAAIDMTSLPTQFSSKRFESP
jgi:hypothetical protein